LEKRNIFVIGLNDFHRSKLEKVRDAERYNFIALLDYEDIAKRYAEVGFAELLRKAEAQLEAFSGPVDGIIGFMDFPVSTMVPILSKRFGLRSESTESMLKCEHKYWSRLEQAESIPDHVPEFVCFDPFDRDPLAKIPFGFPFWVKPLKSFNSYLGYRIRNEAGFRKAMEAIRRQVHRVSAPFGEMLDLLDGTEADERAEARRRAGEATSRKREASRREGEETSRLPGAGFPDEIKGVRSHYCLAEKIISGRQCTLEGCVYDGEILAHGLVDSIRYPGRSVFFRYQYPSRLPAGVKRRIHEVATRFLRHIGYDNASFNIEFFWNQETDKLWLLEVNTRVARHHSELFRLVDGTSNHEILLQLASDRKPSLADRAGPFDMAATFFYRRFEDGVVSRVPAPEEIAAIKESYPGTDIEIDVEEGQRLSEMEEEDSYSYSCAVIYVGANTQQELLGKYEEILSKLDFRFAP
jgi:hypothetical protein